MTKAPWDDLLARFPEPYLLVAVLPDLSKKESIDNAQSAHRLLVRLIKNLPTQGEFAVMVSRQSGKREIMCAFGTAQMPPWLRGLPAPPCQAVRGIPSCLMDRQSENLSR